MSSETRVCEVEVRFKKSSLKASVLMESITPSLTGIVGVHIIVLFKSAHWMGDNPISKMFPIRVPLQYLPVVI